jgi:hypothetical protein
MTIDIDLFFGEFLRCSDFFYVFDELYIICLCDCNSTIEEVYTQRASRPIMALSFES